MRGPKIAPMSVQPSQGTREARNESDAGEKKPPEKTHPGVIGGSVDECVPIAELRHTGALSNHVRPHM